MTRQTKRSSGRASTLSPRETAPAPRPIARRRQKDRNAETRLKLVEAAGRTIFELGYSGASIGAIVERAGLTKGAHLHHFQNKEQLMRATIEHLFDEVRARQASVAQSLAKPQDAPITLEMMEQSLEAAAAAVFDWQFVSLLEIWMAARTIPRLLDAFTTFEARNSAMRLLRLRDAFGADVVDNTELREINGGLNFLLRGLFLQQILGGDWRSDPVWHYWRKEVALRSLDAIETAAPRAMDQ